MVLVAKGATLSSVQIRGGEGINIFENMFYILCYKINGVTAHVVAVGVRVNGVVCSR